MKLDAVYQPRADQSAWWSTTNVGEADPGVLTPLNWTFKSHAGERSLRATFGALGVLAGNEMGFPEQDRDRILGLFYGRIAAKVEFLALTGDRMPGTSGAAVAEQVLGELPAGFRSEPTRKRYAAIAVKMPRALLTTPGRMRRRQAATRDWWHTELAEAPTASLPDAIAQFARARAWFEEVMTLHLTVIFAVIQPIYEQVHHLAAAAGDPELASRALAGQGSHAELDVVEDLWRVSRDEMPLDTFLWAHGYHGPLEGELSSVVWREDPTPVRTLIRSYSNMTEDQSPRTLADRRAADGRDAQRELIGRLKRPQRATAKLVLRRANSTIPLRGVGKVAFLQSIDVARSSARRCGAHLAASHVLESGDDVFYLTVDELRDAATLSQAVRPRVAARRDAHTQLQELTIPSSWHGSPEATRVSMPVAEQTQQELTVVGVGASPGVVEGRVRVVLDPTFADVQAGEIVVAPFTDPSWAPVLFMSTALVVDIGGLLSHAAVVARELGVPCVMGTGNGTKLLRTGDLCRVDGHAGTVRLLPDHSPQASPGG